MTIPASLLVLLVGTLQTSSAFASPSTPPSPGSTSESEAGGTSPGRARLDYELELKGATIEHPDGNSDGRGANFHIRHYQDLAYEIVPGGRLEGGTQFRQIFKPANTRKSNQRAIEFRDPYVGASARDFWKQGAQSASAEAHYYLPITEYNESNRGKPDDEGRGLVHLEAWYSRKLGDFLRLKAPVELNYRLNREELRERYDYWVGFKPSLAYRTGRTTAAKVEYYTGDLNHHSSGAWTRLNDPKLGHSLALQLEWKPSGGTEITPEVKWGREGFRFNAAEMSVSAVFSIL